MLRPRTFQGRVCVDTRSGTVAGRHDDKIWRFEILKRSPAIGADRLNLDVATHVHGTRPDGEHHAIVAIGWLCGISPNQLLTVAVTNSNFFSHDSISLRFICGHFEEPFAD